MSNEEEVLRSLFQAYNDHDAAAASLLYATDGRHADVAAGKPKQGRDAIRDGLEMFFAAFPDAHWQTDVSASGDGHAFVRYVLTGSLQREMWSFSARRQRLELAGVQIIECQDGEIVRSEDYWDAGTFQRQMKAGLDTRSDS